MCYLVHYPSILSMLKCHLSSYINHMFVDVYLTLYRQCFSTLAVDDSSTHVHQFDAEAGCPERDWRDFANKFAWSCRSRSQHTRNKYKIKLLIIVVGRTIIRAASSCPGRSLHHQRRRLPPAQRASTHAKQSFIVKVIVWC